MSQSKDAKRGHTDTVEMMSDTSGKEGRSERLRSLPHTHQPLPPELREAFTALLAEMLMNEAQANPQVTSATVKEPALHNRKPRGQKRVILGEGYKADGR